jgi:DnaJ-domain-containing protein 1
MSIWDRLGGVIRSYLNDDDEKIFGSGRERPLPKDPDLDAAFDELDDFLGGRPEDPRSGGEFAGNAGAPGSRYAKPAPEELRPDFAELGVAFGAPADECRAAYKKLLKIHHPDRHAGHEGNLKKATDRTARINAAYDRIEKWRQEG